MKGNLGIALRGVTGATLVSIALAPTYVDMVATFAGILMLLTTIAQIVEAATETG